MVTDNSNPFIKIKILIIFIWLGYLIIFNTKLAVYLPSFNIYEVKQKKKLLLKNGIVLLGGSNVRMGLSAEVISNNKYECINFGISGEYGSFYRYITLIKGNISPEIIVYSSADIWSEINSMSNEKLFPINIPNISLYKQINSYFLPNSSFFINSFGDQVNYSCDTYIKEHKINPINFLRNNNIIVDEFSNRVKKLKIIFGTNKVFIRVPPIYSSESNNLYYKEIMNHRLKALHKAGITIIEGTLVSSDKSLFCYSNHPNTKGKQLFSVEMKASLNKLRLF